MKLPSSENRGVGCETWIRRAAFLGLLLSVAAASVTSAQEPPGRFQLQAFGRFTPTAGGISDFVSSGIGLGGDVTYALTDRWRAGVEGAWTHLSAGEFVRVDLGDWNTYSGFAIGAYNVVEPDGPVDLLVKAGPGLARFDPTEEQAGGTSAEAFTAFGLTGGVNLFYKLTAAVGLMFGGGAEVTFPTGDEEPGSRTNWVFPLRFGVGVRL